MSEMTSREMGEELQRFLDGELAREELPEGLRAQAGAWGALLADVRRTAVAGAPPWLEGRVLEATAASPESSLRRALGWLMRPRTVRVTPAAALAGLAALIVAAVLPWASVSPPDDGTVIVQLFLEAPSASSVAIAGDFNSWEPIELEDPDGDGVWSAHLAVHPGIYEYMFVLDGNRWVTDPHAERYSADGFGNRNAILAILPEGSGT